MLDLDADIEPGVGLGGIAIGAAVADLLAQAEPVRVVEVPIDDQGGIVTIHSFGAIRTWSVDGVIEQVGAFEGYRGRTAADVGVGSTITEIRAAYGEVKPSGAENMIELPGLPGCGIETTAWTDPHVPEPGATVVQLFVHGTED